MLAECDIDEAGRRGPTDERVSEQRNVYVLLNARVSRQTDASPSTFRIMPLRVPDARVS